MADFIRTEVVEGLQKLYTLRLSFAPSPDGVVLAAQVWIEAISSLPISWCDQDRGRIRKAFTLLLQDVDKWPSPKQLIDRLPARKPLPSLPQPPMSAVEIERNKQHLNQILKKLNTRKKL